MSHVCSASHDRLAADRRLPQDVPLPVFHPQDADRSARVPSVAKGGVGGDHLHRTHAPRADVDRRIRRQWRRDAIATRFADHRLLAQRHAELDGGEVAREVQPFAHGDQTERRVVVVFRLPQRRIELDDRRVER